MQNVTEKISSFLEDWLLVIILNGWFGWLVVGYFVFLALLILAILLSLRR